MAKHSDLPLIHFDAPGAREVRRRLSRLPKALSALVGLFLIAAIVPATASAAECTNTWTGPAEGSWTTAANWSAGHVPNESDVACIGSGKTVNVTTGTQKTSLVQGEGALKLEKSTLELLNGSESSQIGTLTMKFEGNLAGVGTLKVTGSLVWSSESTMSGSGATIIESEASASLTGSKAKLVGREFVNNGTLSYTRQILMSEGAIFKNAGTVLAKAPEAIRVIEGSKTEPSFVNIGTFEKTEGTGAAPISVNFENRGTVNGQTGQIKFEGKVNTLTLADESNLEGTIACEKIGVTANSLSAPKVVLSFKEEQVTVPAGKTASFGTVTMNYEGNVTGSGTLEVTKAFSWAGQSTMSGSGKTVLGSSSVNTIGSGNVNFTVAARTLVNEGTVTQLTYSVLFEKEGGVFENLGTYNANGEKSSWQLRSEGVGSVFVNKGLFRKTEGTGTLKIWSDFKNLGTVQISTGKARFEGSSRSVSFEDESNLEGTIVCEQASVTLDTFTSPNVDISFREEQVTIPAGETASIGTFKMDYKAEPTGAGTLEITKALTWESQSTMSGSGSTVIAPSATATVTTYNGYLTARTLVNEGTLTLQGTEGTIRPSEGATIRNEATLNANSVGAYARYPGIEVAAGSKSPPVLINNGTIQKTVGTNESRLSVNVVNNDTITAKTGSFFYNLAGATVTLAPESVLEGENRFELSGIAAEDFKMPSGTITARESPITFTGKNTTIANLTIKYETIISGSGDFEITQSFNWNGQSTLGGSGTTTLAASSNNTLDSGATVASLSQRTLVNKGTFTQTSSSKLMLAGGTTFRNKGTYNLNSEPYPTWVRDSIRYDKVPSSGRLINEGTFQRTEGKISLQVTPLFQNRGPLNPKSSKIEIQNPETLSDSERQGCSKAGDPISCASGNFSESQTDMAIGGLGVGLVLTRAYSAQAAVAATSPGSFGYGWTASFGDHLSVEESGAAVTLARGDGSTIPFTRISGTAYSGPPWSQETLSGSPEAGYTFTATDQTQYSFSGAGRLESILDRNGNETALSYDEAGRLKAVTDAAGRNLTFAYNVSGQIESVTDPMGHVVKYGYEGGNLTTVTMPGEAGPRWQFKYDASHRITQVTDGRGGKTINEYDGSNRVISQTDPAGRTLTFIYEAFHTTITNEATGVVTDEWFTSDNEPFSITHGYGTASATTETFAYNEAGQMIRRTDGNGHTTTFDYDEAGNRTSEEDPLGHETKWTYNASHDLTSTTTPGGQTTTIKRDGFGNVESISRPAPGEATQITSFVYDEHGQLTSITDPLERTWSYGYDAYGDRTTEIDPLGETRTLAYDEDSRLVAMVSPRGNLEGAEPAEYETTIERDVQGRPLKVSDPLGHATEYSYDGNGNLASQTDAKGHTTKYTYNGDDEQTKVEKPNGTTLETGYDGAGFITSQTNGNGKTTTYVRNVLGQPVEVIDPLGRKTLEEFDAAGNLVALIDPAERTTSYTYDAADRLTGVGYSEEATPSATFEYDANGNLTAMSDGSGESSFAYDQLGRLTRSEDGHGDVVEYGYDLANQQTGIVYPNGKAVSRAYDGVGRLESITDWLGGTTTFGYDADSNLTGVNFPAESGNSDEYAYDRASRMSEAKFKKGSETLASLTYTRDPLGQVEEEARNGLPGPEAVSYGYDENNRLTEAGAASFEYDAADNLTKGNGSTNTYDAASQLETGTAVTYSYDKLGERVKASPSSGPATSYGYDQAGNLTSINRTEEGEVAGIAESFAYDGTGLLVSKTSGLTTKHLAWDSSAALPLLLDDEDNNYVYGPNGLLVEQISSGEEPTYLHHDQIGSTRMLTDAGGETSATFSYAPYGELEGRTGTATTRFGFADQYTDAETGLQYLRARFYDPETGQFLSRDPIEALTGQPYSYGLDDPLTQVDPSGLIAIALPGALGCLAGPVAATACAGVGSALACAAISPCRHAAEEAAGEVAHLFEGDESSDESSSKDAEPCRKEIGDAREALDIADRFVHKLLTATGGGPPGGSRGRALLAAFLAFLEALLRSR
jgi:RHS repeat-associated protein